MAKKANVYKFDVIEKVISEVDCINKEDAVALANKMRDIAEQNKDYNSEVKEAFREAAREINEELTLANLQEIKKIIDKNS